ncbi:hypothetical protein LY90DRAFT_629277 [Neocallimastix californiae]|uniref:Uncharacterized protein n=1 Tax=Neocallimastix californiae TaxID=1754190 RepID=A0A1Y2AVB7_9FUNG|nr:hypothetical protein LY90DRAFT_629277 [Neocallimastix californiae]|eukprot:ORY26538.1 hypothetical protein LY90DRAFT_629277 [Neocallimastix californiae]
MNTGQNIDHHGTLNDLDSSKRKFSNRNSPSSVKKNYNDIMEDSNGYEVTENNNNLKNKISKKKIVTSSSEHHNHDVSLLQKIFNKKQFRNDHSLSTGINDEKRANDDDDDEFLTEGSNWSFNNESMDSQDSLKSLSSSSLKNQFSSDYIRLKLNSDEIDTIRMKANESNIFDDNGDEEFSSENEVESQIKKKGTIKEKSTPESRRASIQISIDKFKPRRRSSTILNLQKIQEGTSSYGLLLAPPLFPQSQSLGDHEQSQGQRKEKEFKIDLTQYENLKRIHNEGNFFLFY